MNQTTVVGYGIDYQLIRLQQFLIWTMGGPLESGHLMLDW